MAYGIRTFGVGAIVNPEPLGGCIVNKFIGRGQFRAWLDAVASVEGATLSPGGVALLMGVARPSVNDMIERGYLECFGYWETEGQRAYTYMEITLSSVQAHENSGRVKRRPVRDMVDNVIR